jgi:hypothetical protein
MTILRLSVQAGVCVVASIVLGIMGTSNRYITHSCAAQFTLCVLEMSPQHVHSRCISIQARPLAALLLAGNIPYSLVFI